MSPSAVGSTREGAADAAGGDPLLRRLSESRTGARLGRAAQPRTRDRAGAAAGERARPGSGTTAALPRFADDPGRRRRCRSAYAGARRLRAFLPRLPDRVRGRWSAGRALPAGGIAARGGPANLGA